MKKKSIGAKLMIILKTALGLYLLLWVFRFYVLTTGTSVIRISFTGLENMFHAPYEYYVSNGFFKAKLPKVLVQLRFKEYSDDRNIYDHDEHSSEWFFVQLQYSPNSLPLFQTDCMIPLNEDGTYLLTYEKWTGSHKESRIPVSFELEKQFVCIARAKYDLDAPVDSDKARWFGGDNIGMMSYMVIPHEDQYMVEINQEEIYTLRSGNLHKLMRIPERGNLDYIYFP